jgi:ribosomal protein S21
MAKTIVEINKNPNENNSSVLRRFSRKVQESQVIQYMKKHRYNERKESKVKIKKNKLRKIAKRQQIEKLRKLGKIR